MKIRHGLLLTGVLVLAGCSWMPFGHHKAAKQQTLMKSLSGEVDYRLTHDLPSDAYLEVTLSDISKQDAPARIIASDRITPVTASPVPFVLSYEPDDVAGGTDFTVSASIKQGGRILATNDTQTRVLGNSGNNGPVLLVVSELH
jgi:putative lipoprotein